MREAHGRSLESDDLGRELVGMATIATVDSFFWSVDHLAFMGAGHFFSVSSVSIVLLLIVDESLISRLWRNLL